MENFRIIATRYNIINILSTIILTMIFFLQFKSAALWSLFLDDDSAIVLIFWPFLALFAIIKINKSSIRRIVHRKLLNHYQANNVNYDEERDAGSLTSEERSYLPTYKHVPRSKCSMDFDMQFWGDLNDLGIHYTVDKFIYNCTKVVGYGKHRKTVSLLKYKGNVLCVDYADRKKYDKNIIFYNSKFNSTLNGGKFILNDKRDVYSHDNIVGHIMYNKELTNEDDISYVINTVNELENFFRKKSRIFVVFEGNRVVILTDEKHKFQIKIPFLIRKATIEELISNQKGNIYRFNMLLNKMSSI